jgi:hypothetical protein
MLVALRELTDDLSVFGDLSVRHSKPWSLISPWSPIYPSCVSTLIVDTTSNQAIWSMEYGVAYYTNISGQVQDIWGLDYELMDQTCFHIRSDRDTRQTICRKYSTTLFKQDQKHVDDNIYLRPTLTLLARWRRLMEKHVLLYACEVLLFWQTSRSQQ